MLLNKNTFLLAALLCVGYEYVFLVNVSLIVGDILPAEQRPTVISEFFKAPLAAKYACELGC